MIDMVHTVPNLGRNKTLQQPRRYDTLEIELDIAHIGLVVRSLTIVKMLIVVES